MSKTLCHALLLAALCAAAIGCSRTDPATQVVATPFTAIRDTVDAPLVSLTNVFGYFADHTQVAKTPSVGVGWFSGHFGPSIGYDISHIVFVGVEYVFGGVDYIVGRSLWPFFPEGLTPFRPKGETWGSLYYPSTRYLWGDDTVEKYRVSTRTDTD